MFDAFFFGTCVMGFVVVGAFIALTAKRNSKRAIACSENIPKTAPIWGYIKKDWEKLQIISSFHSPLFVGGNIFILAMLLIGLTVGIVLPMIICSVLLIVPFEIYYSNKVIAVSSKITRVVID